MKNDKWKIAMKNRETRSAHRTIKAFLFIFCVALSVPAALASSSDGVTPRNVVFYSEGIRCHGTIFTPKGFGPESKAPAVVLAAGWGDTATSIEKYAAEFAERGLVAMVIDYRGWGKSGGFVQTVDAVKTDDRLRFSQMTARVRIIRKRLIPQHQILDIRNALFFLQGEAGVDRTRVGVWGVGMAADHAIVIGAIDARIKAVVAQTPSIEGKDKPRKASAATGVLLQAEQRRARTGQSGLAATSSAELETRLALSEYHPFWYVENTPKTTAVLLLIGEKDLKEKRDSAIAASKLLKGPSSLVSVPGGASKDGNSSEAFKIAATAAADWFLKHL